MKKEFSHRWLVVLLSLFLMTMVICSMGLPVAAAGTDVLNGYSADYVYLPDYPDIHLPVYLEGVSSFCFYKTFSSDPVLYYVPSGSDGSIVYFSSTRVDVDNCLMISYSSGVWSDPVSSGYKMITPTKYCIFGSGVENVDSQQLTVSNFVRPSSSGLLSVFSDLAAWFVSMLISFLGIFYTADSGLTVLGVLACCALGVGVILMIAMFLKKFFHWR